MQIEIRLPEHLWNIKEIRFIYEKEEQQGEKIQQEINEIVDNIHIETARESGIIRREKILGIKPMDTSGLEERRAKVISKWNEKIPYTETELRNRLDNICGRGGYTLNISAKERKAECFIELRKKNLIKTVGELLEELIPLDLTIILDLNYNSYELLEKYTYDQLQNWSNDFLRSEVLK